MFKTHRTYELTTGVKNNTIAVFNNCTETLVLYHKTLVVHYQPRYKRIILRDGGWDTISTRAVINQALSQLPTNAQLIRKRVKGQMETYIQESEGMSKPFVSGMVVRLLEITKRK